MKIGDNDVVVEVEEHHFSRYPNHPWLKNKEEIIKWIIDNTNQVHLKHLKKENIIIKDDLTVSYNGDLNFQDKDIKSIPIQFNKVNIFDISSNNLDSLVGSPFIANEVDVSENNISNFIGLGKYVKNLYVDDNNLKNFEGIRTESLNKMTLSGNNIISWVGFPSKSIIIDWWQNEWCEKTSYELLITAPESVKEIYLNKLMNNNKIKVIKFLSEIEIDMDWLRNEQMIQKTIEIKNSFNGKFKEDLKSNKRKI